MWGSLQIFIEYLYDFVTVHPGDPMSPRQDEHRQIENFCRHTSTLMVSDLLVT
jgi:hypothetical protein